VHPWGDIKFLISLYTWDILFVICVVYIFRASLRVAYKGQTSQEHEPKDSTCCGTVEWTNIRALENV